MSERRAGVVYAVPRMTRNPNPRGRRLPLFCVAIMALTLSCTHGTAPGPLAPPTLRPPGGSVPAVRDVCGNWWSLAPTQAGTKRLIVLPAQEPVKWIEPAIPGLADGAWTDVDATFDGFVWVRGGKTIRFDPRKPDKGAAEAAMPADERTPWQVVARMPASNHDITAAVLGGRLYTAGGLTADFGFPARSRSFDEVWELDPSSWSWRVLAKLGQDRIYCATAAFDGAVWVIGGDLVTADGKRTATARVQRVDPARGAVTEGVPLTVARPMPLALESGGRLYVVGGAAGELDKPGKVESIGPGETAWRPEPDGPAGMNALAGAALGAKLFIVVPKKGLAVFDTASRRWDIVTMPVVPRSCQMTAYRGEIWMMGGVDVKDPRQTLVYDPATGRFRAGPPMPATLSWGAAAVVNGRLLVTGGAGLRSATDHTYVYNDRTFQLRD